MMLLGVFYRPPMGWPIVLLLVGVAVAAALWLAVRHDRRVLIVLLRLTALAALGWVLLGPSIRQPGHDAEGEKPELVLLVDRSASMAERDVALAGVAGEVTRLDALRATWLADETMAKLREHARVEVRAFDEQFYPYPLGNGANASPTGRATRLHDAVARVDAPVTVLLSDGHDTTRDSAGRAGSPGANRRGAVFAVPVGAARGAPDLSVQAWALSDRLNDGQSTEVQVQVYHRGFADRRVSVELLHEGRPIASQEVWLDEPWQTVRFHVEPELAPREPSRVHGYACRGTVLDEEESYTDNNTEDVFIQVTREKTRVLLIEGDPYWDTRSLARLIGAHPDFDLTAIFALGENRQVVTRGEDSPYENELTPEVLRRFDVVVLGREVGRILDAQTAAALAAFVQDAGGAVVFARGEPFGEGPMPRGARDAIETISPVRFGQRDRAALRLTVSDAAQANPLADLGGDTVVSRLPGMIAATRVAGRQSASVVLLEQSAGESPSAAVSTLRAGRGVTLAVLADGLWRWELLPQELDDLDSVYAVFWTRALQWLASGGAFLPGQDVSLTLDRLAADPGEPITLRADMRYADARGFEPAITVTAPDGSVSILESLTPGSTGGVSSRLSFEATGVYRVELTTPGRPDLVDPAHPLRADCPV